MYGYVRMGTDMYGANKRQDWFCNYHFLIVMYGYERMSTDPINGRIGSATTTF